MATQAEIAVLKGTATEVKNESQVGGNTAARVGGLFEGIVDALPSDEAIDGKITQAVNDIQPIVIEGNVDNAPDQEDLTSVNQGGTDVLKFKNKSYAPALFSGLGRVYLRKNVVTPENLGYAVNLLTAEMVSEANTIYHIQYDYDLNGQTITLPAGCVLEFEGGSLTNGTLVGNNTQLRGIGKDCLLCDFGGSFSDIDIDVEVLGLHPSTASVNQQDAFDRLSNFIGAVETINVSFPIGIYAYGGGSNTPQGTSAPRAYYNYYGIFLKPTYRTKNLSIYGNGSTFIPAIPFYVGAWNYADGELTPNYTTDNISVWTKGGGFFRTQCDMNSLCFYDCVVDGNLEYNNYGGAQTATQEQFGVGMESASLQNFIAKGCIFKNNVTDGVALGAVPYVSIKDCKFIKNMRWGISMSAAGVIEISNCDFSDNGKIFSVNNYYKFEGNWGDIDVETGSDAPSREITILNCRFKGTGGASSVVANRNVKSFVIDGCSFAYDTTQMAYSGTSIIYKDSFTMPINVRFVNGECSVRNIEATNARMFFVICGVNPSSSDIPSDETNLFFRGDSHKYRAQYKNIILRYTDDCIGFDTTSALPYAGLVTNQSVNFIYNGTRWDLKDVSNEESHYGDADVENIQVHLISHVCIGEYNATAERTNTAFSNMVVFVNNSSNKNYFKRFKNNITGSIILNDLHVFDNANNDVRTIYVENLKKRVEDNGNIIYHGSASVPSIRFADDADCFRTAGAAGGMVAGTTAKTPSVGMSLGVPYFDTTKGRPVFWNGSAYVDALGGLNSLRAISISQADYDALQTKDPNTLYVIV